MWVGGLGRRFKVAIIGGGPGGLGAAIELSNLPFVQWDLYEKKPQISETGGGISLQLHTWKLLEHNGTAANIAPDDYFRAAVEQTEQRRNGRTGELLHSASNDEEIPPIYQTCRLSRATLQAALLQNVDQTHVHVNMKLTGVQHLPSNRVRITFQDGFSDEVDLLVGADGIRSFIRRCSLPDYSLRYNGQTVYRTIISKAEALKINGIPQAPVFWKHVSGLYVYTCPLGNDEFEVTVRIRRSNPEHGQVSWGRSFDLDILLHQFSDFCLPVRQALDLAAAAETQEFALLSGPRLESMVFHDNVAFIGDAAHALCGNFGAGAGFALEDVYTLARSLEWIYKRDRPLKDALELYDSIRSPHYHRLYELITKFAKIKAGLGAEGLPIDEEIEQRIQRIAQASETWMYYYEIDKVVDEVINEVDKSRQDAKHGRI